MIHSQSLRGRTDGGGDETTQRIKILLELEQEAHDRAARQSAREIAKLETAYDPLSRATIRYEQEWGKLSKALERGGAAGTGGQT